MNFLFNNEEEEEERSIPYKIAVVGPQSGKSCLICRFLFNEFKEEGDPTVEDSYTHLDFVVDELYYKLNIVDTSGNDFYSNLYPNWFGNADGFLIVYSTTSIYSFDSIPQFVQEIQKIKKVKTFPMVLVATQADMEMIRVVSSKEGDSIARRLKCPFLEASAKTGDNINEVFQSIVQEIRESKLQNQMKDIHQSFEMENEMKVSLLGYPTKKNGIRNRWKKIYDSFKDGLLYLKGSKEYVIL